MSRLKLIMLAAFAVCALGAAVSSSASAVSYLVLGGFLQTEEPFTSTGGPATLATAGTEIICEEANGTGGIQSGGLGLYHITFTTCRVTKPATCKVAEPILVHGLHHIVNDPGGLLLIKFLPSTPPVFVNIKFENNGGTCSIAGEQSVEGTASGIPVGGEAHKLTQELEFTNASSALTLAGIKANFKLKQKITLNSDMSWGGMMQ